MSRCLNMEEIADLVDSPDILEEKRSHLEDCPRCHALWLSFQSFQQPLPLAEGADIEDARTKMRAALAEEMSTNTPSGNILKPRRGFRLPRRTAVLVAAAAVVLVAVGTILYSPEAPTPSPSGILRGEESGVQPSATLLANGGLDLSWPAFPDADGYRVLFFNSAFEEIGHRDTATPGMTLSGSDLDDLGHPVIWRVAILRSGDEMFQTEPSYLPDR